MAILYPISRSHAALPPRTPTSEGGTSIRMILIIVAVTTARDYWRIGIWAEAGDASVGQTISLQPLEDFLRVMHHGGRRVERDGPRGPRVASYQHSLSV